MRHILYKKVIKDPWPYWVAAIILALANILLLLLTGEAWRVTTGFVYWGSWILNRCGYQPMNSYFMYIYNEGLKSGETFLFNTRAIMNLAVIMGAVLAILWSSEFKWKKIRSRKQLFFGLLGGLLMGYGSRMSFGCNIGAFLSAIPSFSLHGWVYGFSMFIGAWIGSKILMKHLI